MVGAVNTVRANAWKAISQYSKSLLLLVGVGLLTSCVSDIEPIVGCVSKNGLTPICQFHNPEDIVSLPGTQLLVVSEMGNMEGTESGVLSVFDVVLNQKTVLFSGTKEAYQILGDDWGSSDCPGIPDKDFSPHGIDLLTRKDGRLQLMVVNHGERETVEFFELVILDGNVRASWRGCVPVPNDEYMNDVAALSDGGFVASHMFDKHLPYFMGKSTGLWKGLLGINTGYLFEWHSEVGFKIIPGSQGAFINGLSISADERMVFANAMLAGEVRKIDRLKGELVAVAEVVRPDNSSWDVDGQLLVVSQSFSSLDILACMDESVLLCPVEFRVIRIDPKTMRTETILVQEGSPMGAGTVATQLGNKLYIGSFQSDRIVTYSYVN